MASIFSLFGEIFIDNEKANKGIEETTKKGESAGSKIGSAFSGIVKGAAAIGTAVVGAATTIGAGAMSMVNSTAEYADEIDKLSERTGINREELQRWKHAADQSGVSVDSFKNGVKKMSDVIADANSGSKTAQASLEGLGLSLDDLNKMTPEQAFNAVTKSLADMEEGTARNALGNDLLGKSYTEMLPLLNAGSDGIASLKQEADDLGLVMSEDAVKSGVVFGDTLANIKDAAGGLVRQLGSALMPILQTVLDAIIANMPMIQSVIAQITPIITQMFSEMMPPLMDLGKQIFPLLMDLIMQLLPPLMQIISAILPVITEFLSMLLPPIIQIAEAILPLLLSLIEPLLGLLEPLLGLLQPILDLLVTILDPLVQILDFILPPLIDLITWIIDDCLKSLQEALGWLCEVIGVVVTAVLDGIMETIDDVGKAFSDSAQWIQDAWSVICDFFQGVWDGICDVFWGVADWFSGVFQSAYDAITGVWNGITGFFSGIWNGVLSVTQGVWNAIWGAIKGTVNGILRGIEGMVNGVIRGINWLIGGIDTVANGLGSLFGQDWHVSKLNTISLPRLRVGMDYVPYDEFPAMLHRGETVLTKAEADEYRKGGKGVEINIYNPNFTDAGQVDRIMDEVVSRLRLAGVRP